MKTLSDHPGLIGRILAADERRREHIARRRWFLRRLSWHLQWLCDGAVRWVLLPLVKFGVVVVAGLGLAAVLISLFAAK